MITPSDHKKLAEKALTQAAKEHGMELTGSEVVEIEQVEMPKRPPDYCVTLPIGVKIPVWEEPVLPPNDPA